MRKVLTLSFALFFALVLSTAFSEAASARTLYTSPAGTGGGLSAADPATLPNAFSLALDGDTVSMASGTYTPTGTVYIGKKINVVGPDAVIDCSLLTYCFEYNAYLGSGYYMSGLTFQNFFMAGVSVKAGSSPILTDLIFEDPNVAPWWETSAILVDGDKANPLIENSSFYGLRWSDGSYYDRVVGVDIIDGSPKLDNLYFQDNTYGVAVEGTLAEPSIENSVFEKNYWGVISYESNPTLIQNNSFWHSESYRSSGGVYVSGATSTHIVLNSFENLYFGVSVTDADGESTVQVLGNTFTGNVSGVHLRDDYSSTYVSQSLVANNSFDSCTYCIKAEWEEGNSKINANTISNAEYGMYFTGGSNPVVTNNLISGSTTAGIYSEDSDAMIAYNTVVNGNKVGLLFANDDTSYVVNNIIYGNLSTGVFISYTSVLLPYGYNDSYNNGVNVSGPYINLGGNTSVDPLFVSATDFHLQATSPLANYGYIFYVNKDIAGIVRTPRVGAVGPEIGAYEL